LLTRSAGMGREGGGQCGDPAVLPGNGTVIGVRPAQPAKLQGFSSRGCSRASPGRVTPLCPASGRVPSVLWSWSRRRGLRSHCPRRSPKPQGPWRASAGVKVGMAGGCRGDPRGRWAPSPAEPGGPGAVVVPEQCAASPAAEPANPSGTSQIASAANAGGGGLGRERASAQPFSAEPSPGTASLHEFFS